MDMGSMSMGGMAMAHHPASHRASCHGVMSHRATVPPLLGSWQPRTPGNANPDEHSVRMRELADTARKEGPENPSQGAGDILSGPLLNSTASDAEKKLAKEDTCQPQRKFGVCNLRVCEGSAAATH